MLLAIRYSLFALALALALPCGSRLNEARADDDQVNRGEVVRLGDHVEHVDGITRHSGMEEASAVLAAVPADDNHKWFISVVGRTGCNTCARLRSDLAADQQAQKHLGAFVTLADEHGMHGDPKRSWSHYNYFYVEDRSQQFRFAALRLRSYPTVIVQPPLNKRYGDPTNVVFLKQGYDGRPDALCRDISGAIKAYIARQVDRRSARRGGNLKAPLPPPGRAELSGEMKGPTSPGQTDPPWSPAPKVEPVPSPSPGPDTVLPPGYDIPPKTPAPAPAPAPEGTPAAPAGAIPATPELTIVVDGNVLSEADRDRLSPVVDRIMRARPGMITRFRDWREAKHLCKKDDLPALVTTSEGKIDDKVSARLLPFLRPTPVDQTPRSVGLADIPWGTLISLLFGGGVGGLGFLGIVVWGLRALRALRIARGQATLFDDATFARLMEMIEALRKQTPAPAK